MKHFYNFLLSTALFLMSSLFILGSFASEHHSHLYFIGFLIGGIVTAARVQMDHLIRSRKVTARLDSIITELEKKDPGKAFADQFQTTEDHLKERRR